MGEAKRRRDRAGRTAVNTTTIPLQICSDRPDCAEDSELVSQFVAMLDSGDYPNLGKCAQCGASQNGIAGMAVLVLVTVPLDHADVTSVRGCAPFCGKCCPAGVTPKLEAVHKFMADMGSDTSRIKAVTPRTLN